MQATNVQQPGSDLITTSLRAAGIRDTVAEPRQGSGHTMRWRAYYRGVRSIVKAEARGPGGDRARGIHMARYPGNPSTGVGSPLDTGKVRPSMELDKF